MIKTYTWPPKFCFQMAFFTLRKSAFNNQGNWIPSSSSSWIDPLYIATTFKRERSLMKRLLTGLNHMLVHGATRLFSLFCSVANSNFMIKIEHFYLIYVLTNFGRKKFSINWVWNRRYPLQVWQKLKFCNFSRIV